MAEEPIDSDVPRVRPLGRASCDANWEDRWRNTVGSLVEFLWLKEACHGPQFYWHMRERPRGTVSSNSRFQTVLFQ